MTKSTKIRRCGLLLLLLWGCFLVREIQAQADKLVLTSEVDEVALGRQVDYWEDVSGQMTVMEVVGEADGRFQPLTQETPNFGFTSSAYWFRVRVQLAAGERPSTWWLEISNASLDQIDLYIPDGSNGFTHQQTGSTVPYNSALIQHHYPAFALDLAPGVDQTVYLRIVENAAMIVPMTLFTSEGFINDIQAEQIFLGLNYGILLVMLVYNLFLYFFLRQSSYLYYVAFIASYILGQASNDGLAHQYLWPNLGQWNDVAGPFFAPLAMSAFLYFTAEFLQARHYVPRFHRLKKLLVGLWGLLFLLIPFLSLRLLTPPLLLLLIISVGTAVLAGLGAWRRGHRPARIFLIAWSLPLLGAIIFALTQLGSLPFSLLTQQSPRLGIMFMATLLSVALADQINIIRRQKEAALAQAQALNEVLEERVVGRTAELAASNQHLLQLIAERKQVEISLRQQTSQLEALREIALEITAELDLPVLLQSIVSRAAELMRTKQGGLFLWEPEMGVLALVATTAKSGLPIGTVLEPGESMAGKVWASGQPLIVNNYEEWSGRVETIAEKIGDTAVLSVPIQWRSERSGVLAITARAGRIFTEEDVALLKLFALQAAVAIQNVRLLAEIQADSQTLEMEIFERRQAQDLLQHYRGHLEDRVEARTTELEAANQLLAQHNQVLLTLHAASLAVTSSLNLSEVLNTVTQEMAQLLNITMCDVLIWDEPARTMTMVAGYRLEGQLEEEAFAVYDLRRYPLSEQVLVEKEIRQMTISQADLDPQELAYMRAEGTKTLLMMPILFHNQSLGMITLEDHYGERVFTEEEIALAQLFSYQAANAIENARFYEQAQQLIVELEAKNAELERFTYTVSHDLKSPLVTVKGFLGFLEKDVLQGDMQRVEKDMAWIREATIKMEHLLDDLLELSRIGRLVNTPQRVSFNALVEEALQLVAGQINQRGVQLKVAPHMPMVYADQPRMVEVLQNLVDNGVKFMGSQAEPTIEIGFREEVGEGVFFVRDNGIGIEPRYYEKVFGLFDRLDPMIEGTGIGLALVKRIVEVHNGRIWIETTPDQPGTSFCFTLPLV